MSFKRFTSAAMLLLLLALAGWGCGRRVVSEPAPDIDLAKKIRGAKAEGAEGVTLPSAAETGFSGEWGNLTGRFIFDGAAPTPPKLNVNKDEQVCGGHNLVDEGLLVSPEGGLANVVLYVFTKKVPIHADYEATANDQLTFDNKNCRFEPHILPLRLTQTLVIHNSDPVGHNSNISPLGEQGINPLLAAMGSATHQFSKPQNTPVVVTCNIHPWMKGYVLPRDNPYVAVSAEDGSFAIENLPAGELEFQVWQESVGALAAKPEWKRGRFEMQIQPGENDLGTINVSSSLFAK